MITYRIMKYHEDYRVGECEFMEVCPFFNDKLKRQPNKVEELKEKYCRNNNLNCARYMVAHALGREMMPEELYPHETHRAYLLIGDSC